MGFINPFLLFGLLAAGIPFLIHLWNKRQAKIVDFSSLRFLLVAHRKRVRRLQIKQWLILLLRMLIIMLIVLALARPLLKNRFSFAGTRSKTSCVIIIDNSYSMGYKGIKGQRFEIAREKALEVVDSLEKGDSASLILMSDIAEPVFRKLTNDLALVRNVIQNSVLSNRTTYIPPSIKLASSILADSKDPNKEIYLITDFDQNGWEGWKNLELDQNVRLFAIKIRPDSNLLNVAIEKIRLSNKLISINSRVKLDAEITNFSDSRLDNITVTLFVDGKKRRSINAEIPAGETVVQSFTHKFDSPGTHTGRFEITGDGLSVDDVRYFAMKVYGQIKALCVGKKNLYLSLAMNPEISIESEDSSLISASIFLPTVCTPDELDKIPMEEYDVVILADMADLNVGVSRSERATLKRLRNFVSNGKSLIAFVSEEYKAEYNELELFPARLDTPISFETPVRIAAYDEGHPIFNKVFSAQHFSGEDSASFQKIYKLVPSDDAKIIAKFSTDIPAILEKEIGRGRVFLFNTNVSDLSWSNFVLKPIFLPLLHQTVLYAISEKENRTSAINLEVGTVFSEAYYDFASSPVAIKNTTVGSVRSTVVVGNNGVVEYDQIQSPGIYQIEIQGKERIKRDFFAVNVDTSESNLADIDLDRALGKFNNSTILPDPDFSLGGEAAEASSDQGKLKRTLNSYRMGKEIWSVLLLVAIALMFVEVYLANREA